LKTSLVKGLDKTDAEEIKGLFVKSLRLRKRLIKLAEEKITSSHLASLDRIKFENASWAYYQADSNGYERGLLEMISILTDEEDK